MPTSPIRAFAIYDQRDEDLFKDLSRHLAPLARLKMLTLNSPGSALAGDRVDAQIESLKQYDLLLVLLSSNLLASDEAYAQVERAMALQRSPGIRVVPILARPVDFKGLPLAELLPLPRNGRAVTEWESRDAAWYEIAQGLRAVLAAPETEPRPTPEPPAPPSPESPPPRSEGLDWRNPASLLKAAMAAVPVMKYALGVAGLAAVVALVTLGFGLDPATAIVGALVVVALMAVLIVLAAAQQSRHVARQAIVLTWGYVFMTLGASFLLLTSLFFQLPRPLRCLVHDELCKPPHSPSPPPPPPEPSTMKLHVRSDPTGAKVWTAGHAVFCDKTPCSRDVPAHAPLELLFDSPGHAGTFKIADPAVELPREGIKVSIPPREVPR